MTDFSDDAVSDMADVFDALDEDDTEAGFTARDQVEMLEQIGEVCDVHGVVDADDRIDLTCAGLSRWFDRRKQQAVSDFRQFLEASQL